MSGRGAVSQQSWSAGSRSVLSQILQSWEPSITAYEQARDANVLSDASESRGGSFVADARDLLVAEHDALADVLGKAFALPTDELIEQDLQDIENSDLIRLFDLITGQGNGAQSAKNAIVSKGSPKAAPAPKAESLAQSASEKTLKALHDLAARLGYHLPSTVRELSRSKKALFGDEDTSYCQGALLLQRSKAELYSVVKKQRSDQHLVCKYCYLEISDFRASAQSYTGQDWSMLASCHILACSSLRDRRAAFRCFACLARGHDVIEPSAAGMQDHFETCEFMKAYKIHAAQLPPSPPDSPDPNFSDSLYTQLPANGPDAHHDTQYGFQYGAQYDTQPQQPPAMPRRPSPLPAAAPASRAVPNFMPFLSAGSSNGRNQTPPGAFPADSSFTNAGRSPGLSPSRTPSRTPQPGVSNRSTTPSNHSPNQQSGFAYNENQTNYPPRQQNSVGSSAAVTGTEDINTLLQLGISRADAQALLERTGGNVAEAAELAFGGG